MRDLVVLIFVYGSLPVAALHPKLGILVFSWVTYMRPQDLAWGLGETRLLLYVALALIISLVHTIGRVRVASLRAETFLMIGFAIWLAVTTQHAMSPEVSQYWFESVAKMIFVAVVTTGVFITKDDIRLLLVVIGGSIGFLGLKFAVYSILAGGVHFTEGPGGLFSDNNAFALGLNMAIPILVALARTENLKVVKQGYLILAFGCALTVIFTESRGGFVTLVAVAVLLGLQDRKNLKVLAIVALVVAIMIPVFAPSVIDEYTSRLSTIQNYEADTSAMGRIEAWQTAIRMWRANPVFGVGPENFLLVRNLYGNPTGLVAHNTYLQILSENGLPGLVLFVGLIVVSTVRLQILKVRLKGTPLSLYAEGVMAAIVAFVVGATFINMAYLELIYHLFALSACLSVASLAVADSRERDQIEVTSSLGRDETGAWWKVPSSIEGATR